MEEREAERIFLVEGESEEGRAAGQICRWRVREGRLGGFSFFFRCRERAEIESLSGWLLHQHTAVSGKFCTLPY